MPLRREIPRANIILLLLAMNYTKCKICSSTVSSYNPKLQLIRCNDCGLIFFEEHLNNYNRSLYTQLYNDGTYGQHIDQQKLIETGMQPKLGYNKSLIIRKVLSNRGELSLAELGAGVGVVAKYLAKRGYEYTGFELNEAIALRAQSYGLNILPVGFEGLDSYQNQFDVVLAFEVLEHIDDLGQCFGFIAKSLKVNGVIGISVPNFEKYKNYETIQTRLFQDKPPIHINFFTLNALSRILKYHNLEPVYLKVRPFPDLNFKSLKTYRLLGRMLMGRYYGSTILGVARKIL